MLPKLTLKTLVWGSTVWAFQVVLGQCCMRQVELHTGTSLPQTLWKTTQSYYPDTGSASASIVYTHVNIWHIPLYYIYPFSWENVRVSQLSSLADPGFEVRGRGDVKFFENFDTKQIKGSLAFQPSIFSYFEFLHMFWPISAGIPIYLYLFKDANRLRWALIFAPACLPVCLFAC